MAPTRRQVEAALDYICDRDTGVDSREIARRRDQVTSYIDQLETRLATENIEFASDEAVELYLDLGMEPADLEDIEPSGETGYVLADIRKAAKALEAEEGAEEEPQDSGTSDEVEEPEPEDDDEEDGPQTSTGEGGSVEDVPT